MFKDFVVQRDKISVKICVLHLSFQKPFLFELFDRGDVKVAERVFLASLSIASFQVLRNMYMFIAIIYMQYIKSKGRVGKHCDRNVLRLGLNESSL